MLLGFWSHPNACLTEPSFYDLQLGLFSNKVNSFNDVTESFNKNISISLKEIYKLKIL